MEGNQKIEEGVMFVIFAGIKLAEITASRCNRSMRERAMAAQLVEKAMPIVQDYRLQNGARLSEAIMEVAQLQEVLDKLKGVKK